MHNEMAKIRIQDLYREVEHWNSVRQKQCGMAAKPYKKIMSHIDPDKLRRKCRQDYAESLCRRFPILQDIVEAIAITPLSQDVSKDFLLGAFCAFSTLARASDVVGVAP